LWGHLSVCLLGTYASQVRPMEYKYDTHLHNLCNGRRVQKLNHSINSHRPPMKSPKSNPIHLLGPSIMSCISAKNAEGQQRKENEPYNKANGTETVLTRS